MGPWQVDLAEWYATLIPKDGPTGPLNTRPLMVLSRVYQLWPAICMVDAISWGGHTRALSASSRL